MPLPSSSSFFRAARREASAHLSAPFQDIAKAREGFVRGSLLVRRQEEKVPARVLLRPRVLMQLRGAISDTSVPLRGAGFSRSR